MRGGGPPGGLRVPAWVLVGVVLPGPALAHASERMVLMTLPTGPFVVAAALAVVLTAVAGRLSRRLPSFRAHVLAGWRQGRDWGSWLAAAVWGLLVAAGFLGSRDPLENPLPLMVWTVVWVGLVLGSAVFGDLWRPVSPWRAPARAIRRGLGRSGGIGLGRLGHVPAVAGLFGFLWFEIVALAPADPAVLARVVAGYGLAVLVLAVLEGEDWLERGEFLTVYFGLIGRIAPLWRDREAGRVRLMAGLPGAQIAAMPGLGPGAVGFVTLALAGVSFDGLAETFWWLARVGINPLEFPGRSAVLGVNTLGLIAVWALVGGSILGAVALGRRLAGQTGPAGPVWLAFLPIATGYHLAHYLVALLTQGQYAVAALNDPLERGWALIGLPEHWVSFGFLGDRGWVWAIWGVEFGLILGAHLLAVVLALVLGRRSGGGLAADLPVTGLMVGYTVLGLWLLAAPAAG